MALCGSALSCAILPAAGREPLDVQEDALEVRIRAEGLASLVAELPQDPKRRAARRRTSRVASTATRWSCGSPCAFKGGVVASALSRRTEARLGPAPSRSLMARLSRWQRMLESGEYGTVAELADAERISRSCVPIDRVNLPASPRWAARSNVSRTPHSIRVGGHGFPPPRAKRILSARESRRLAGPKGNDHFVRVGALNQLPAGQAAGDAARSRSSVRTMHDIIEETMPDPVPKPPGRAPAEPIIIRDPTRPAEKPEIDRSPDQEEEPEIKMPPEIIPEMPPPPGPGEQAA
jgi:hypothetical protein